MIRWLASLAVVAACSELPVITEGVCGNGVIESHEDCDDTNVRCIDCRWECTDITQLCPELPGHRCGADNFCHGPTGAFAQTPVDSIPFPVIGFRISDIDRDGYGDVVGLNATALNVRYGDLTGELPESYNVVTPQVQGSPQITHLVSEDVDDLVLPTADGLVVYTGAFGVPSPRQFPLGGDQGPENMGGRPDPFDAVQIDDTIGLFGPTSASGPAALVFGLITLTRRGPMFDAETTDLCGLQATSAMTYQQNRIASYDAAGATFVAFTNNGTTCVIEVSKPLNPIERTPPPSQCPQRDIPGEEACVYAIRSVRAFPEIVKRPVFADLDDDGCPSLLVQDAGIGAIEEYPGTSDITGCILGDTPRSLVFTDDPASSEIIGSIALEPPVTGMARDAVITAWGIHAVPLLVPPVVPRETTLLYISDRPVRRAVTGDVNSDGRTDVVLSTGLLPNLDIARRVPGSDAFLLVRTPTSGPVVYTMMADYDGDVRDDLAYVESLGDAERLSIAYGTPTGLGPGIAADAFRNVEFMSSMQVIDSTDPFGLVDDLIVIDLLRTSMFEFQSEITILHGSPSRTMLSFYGLPVPVIGAAFRGVVAGDFIDETPLDPLDPRDPDTRSAGVTDLVAFQTYRPGDPACAATTCRTALWIVPGLPNARLGEAQFVTQSTMGEVKLPGTHLINACGGGFNAEFCIQTAKLVAWPITEDHDIIIGIDSRRAADDTVLAPHVLRFDPAQPWSDSPSPVSASPFPPKGHIKELFVFDVDADGMPELIAPFRATPNRTDGHTKICPMQRDGSFAGPCIDVAEDILHDSALECVDAWPGRVVPVCEVPDQAQQLVVLCRELIEDTELQVSRWQSYAIQIHAGFTGSKDSALLSVASKLEELQLGDVTGDSVDDIVTLDISTGTPALQVFPQLDTRDFDACNLTDEE